MADLEVAIQKKFEEANRFPSFGNVITRIHVQGFRCHTNTWIDIKSPITAFCGLNGTGKSTILQLAANAYRSALHQYHVKDFFIVGPLDPHPYTDQARVEFQVWQQREIARAVVAASEGGLQAPKIVENIPEPFYARTVSLTRNSRSSRWNGYKNRPERVVFFAGFGQYLPKVEQHDFMVGKSNKLQVRETRPVADIVRQWICRVLALNYEQINANTVVYTGGGSEQVGSIVSVHRQGISYSESNMGYGEGRTQFLITAIENLPEKSLVLIEEPETSLHPSAQFQLGKYLIDVVNRRKHQVLLTTHSTFLLSALPSDSRVYLRKAGANTDVLSGLSPWQIRSLLAEGNVKALDILVEDDVAEAILKETIRLIDPVFLEVVSVHVSGACQDIKKTIETLSKTKLPIVAVLDGDQNPDTEKNLFTLPGPKVPPEVALINEPAVGAFIHDNYGLNLDDFRATLANIEHHSWFRSLATRLNQNRTILIGECARVFARAQNVRAGILIEQLKGALE